MKPAEAVSKFRSYMRLRHLALSTEQSYCAWLERFMRFLDAHRPAHEEEPEAASPRTAHEMPTEQEMGM